MGERLITGATSDYSDDTLALLGAVYKIAAVEENGVFTPRIKISGTVEKITNPGLKKVYRIYDQNGKAKADLIAKADEEIDMSGMFRFVDPKMPWRNLKFANCTAKPLQVKIFENGKRVYELPALEEIRGEQYAPQYYNDEQALRAVIKYAYIAAFGQYVKAEEIPSGKGIADVVFIPAALSGFPAMVIELKWNKTSGGAVTQIKNKKYDAVLHPFAGNILLVGINYDEKTGKHACTIEKR